MGIKTNVGKKVTEIFFRFQRATTPRLLNSIWMPFTGCHDGPLRFLQIRGDAAKVASALCNPLLPLDMGGAVRG